MNKKKREAHRPTNHRASPSKDGSIMDQETTPVKATRRYDWSGKDWHRHARLMQAMHEKQVTESSILPLLGSTYSQGYINRVLWGLQRPQALEEQIAAILGKPWSELFGTEAGKAVAA